MKVTITGVPETMLIPLWAKAEETKRSDRIISDDKAIEIINNIDYDFSQFKNSKFTQAGVAVRTMLYDNAVKKFIKEHPRGTVINIGAGLDTRFSRVDNGEIRWYDIDLPESIEFRKNFFEDSERCKMISKSVFDYSWVDEVEKNNDTFVIAEGFMMYFSEEQVVSIFKNLPKYFGSTSIVIDTVPVMLTKKQNLHDSVKTSQAKFMWGANNAKDIEKLGVKVRNSWMYYDYCKNRWGFLGVFIKIPILGNMVSNGVFLVDLEM